MDDTTARQLQSRATPLELINLEEPNETRHFEKVEHVGLVLSGRIIGLHHLDEWELRRRSARHERAA